MFNVLIDTSVWLDLAENQKQTPLVSVLIEFFGEGQLNLLLPRTVVIEFNKNRDRIAKSSARSLQTHFNLVKDAIRKVDGPKRQKDKVLDFLSDVDHKIPMLGGAAQGTLDRIEEVFEKATIIEPTDAVKAKAADRALNRKAPCHHDKNSIADAVLIETYFECVKNGKAGERFAFVTHNKHDFSLVNGNQKLPHGDLAGGFSKIKSLYFINLADCLRRIDPLRVTHLMWELEWDQQPRGLSEILRWIDTLTTQVWHNRHMNREYSIANGKTKLVTKDQLEAARRRTGKMYQHNLILEDVWKGAVKAARAAERRLGRGNHGPWTDFEWGMINGKLSALRWVLGDEWDMLDT